MANFIDRRLNSKNKSMVNRQRFFRRHKNQIKRSLADSINDRKVTDLTTGQDVSIAKKDLLEPVFRQGDGGSKNRVFAGNDQFAEGDKIPRPKAQGGQGSGAGNASDRGQGQDDFVFSISHDEYLNLLFDDLELPNLQKSQLDKLVEYKTVRSGYCAEGVPANIDIVKSLQGSIARRIAMTSGKRRELKACEQELEQVLASENHDPNIVAQLQAQIDMLKERISAVPFIDSFDMHYRNYDKQAVPTSKAVMFCLMDVSGSMVQATKDIAKRFYILLYLFLSRTYQTIDVVYIIHHTQAKEVDEQDFFYSRETGGTIVSSALELMQEIVAERYSSGDWNIYAAQASDGDNWQDDTEKCYELLKNQILPAVRFYAYIEITQDLHKSLWQRYRALANSESHFAMRRIREISDIYPVFRDLFKKSTNGVSAGVVNVKE
ncbi:YeaH/YhbH family protein [Thalassotalea mangrovi]|uniref:UPF0229 protein E8M12_08990 n=1 Tax=Thalassotalea mangrovi TaxID=2572245 RepID=A0A4U1B4Y1_9GAMM|nr:YeaH/YhbH family protein [Thalassotalea mangrovi]TKB45326.1 YeaH/YhbH family protein [Thalassotalea mangrovi]